MKNFDEAIARRKNKLIFEAIFFDFGKIYFAKQTLLSS